MLDDAGKLDIGSVRYPIVIDQRADWILYVDLFYVNGDPVDLTGYSGKMQVRKTPSDEAVIVEISSDGVDPGIVFDPVVLNRVKLKIPHAVTKLLTAPNEGVYDLLLTSPSNIIARVLEGPACISAGVTEEEEEE